MNVELLRILAVLRSFSKAKTLFAMISYIRSVETALIPLISCLLFTVYSVQQGPCHKMEKPIRQRYAIKKTFKDLS